MSWRATLVALLILAASCDSKGRRAQVSGGAGVDAAPTGGCEAAVANLARVAPALVNGGPADLEECRKLPAALVACLAGAVDAAAAEACVDLALAK